MIKNSGVFTFFREGIEEENFFFQLFFRTLVSFLIGDFDVIRSGIGMDVVCT